MDEINVQQAMKLTFITSLITNLEVGQLKTHLNKCVWAVKKNVRMFVQMLDKFRNIAIVDSCLACQFSWRPVCTYKQTVAVLSQHTAYCM